jgi:hypothetical protein
MYVYIYILCIYRPAYDSRISSKDTNFVKIYQASSKAYLLSLRRVRRNVLVEIFAVISTVGLLAFILLMQSSPVRRK